MTSALGQDRVTGTLITLPCKEVFLTKYVKEGFTKYCINAFNVHDP